MIRAEQELVERCRAGDEAAFEELYHQHASRVFNLARRMTGSPEQAEDLLQEAFLQAYRKIGAFRGDSSISTWLYRVATNICLDYLRSREGQMARRSDFLDEHVSAEPAAAPDGLGVVGRMDLERAIAQLPPAARAAFLLHDVEGFEHREIATILGISDGTSKSQVHKARLRLRALLAGERARSRQP